MPTGDHASCDHTATTDRDHRPGGARPGESSDGITETTLPPWQDARLAMLLDALDGMALSDGERASLTWLAGFESHTVKNIAAVISRARQTP